MPTIQIDWVEQYNNQQRITFAQMRKIRAQAWADLQHLHMQRKFWKKVPVSKRPRHAITVFAKYQAAKANLRRLKRLSTKAGLIGPEIT